MTISAGLVEGVEPDRFYLKLDRENDEPLTLFLRADEMLAVVWVCNGALWTAQALEVKCAVGEHGKLS